VAERVAAGLEEIDPFDLPDWLGTDAVTWTAGSGLRSGSRVTGVLDGEGGSGLGCDLLAVDLAYPAPVVSDAVRVRAHQQWQHGQVLLVRDDAAPVVLAVPGSGFGADVVLDAVARLARAVGAPVSQYAVHLRLGRERS
jgi:hypothetical protein